PSPGDRPGPAPRARSGTSSARAPPPARGAHAGGDGRRSAGAQTWPCPWHNMFVAALFVTARMVEVDAPARYRSRMHGEMEAGDLPVRRFARLGGALRRPLALFVDVALPELCAPCREPVEGPG